MTPAEPDRETRADLRNKRAETRATGRRSRGAPWIALAGLAAVVAAIPAAAAPGEERLSPEVLAQLSQPLALQYFLAHPDEAPAPLRESLAVLAGAGDGIRGEPQPPDPPPPLEIEEDRFNDDESGLPQNEESIAVCRSDPSVVLGATNDLRGRIDPEGNLTGWHLSLDGGETLANEGLLPPVEIDGVAVPSSGDPVVAADADCNLYAGSLNSEPLDSLHEAEGIGVYKSDPATLAGCPGGSAPSCWPTRRGIAKPERDHLLDKEWIDVGESGGAGTVVWAVFADFALGKAPGPDVGMLAVRCDANLVACTEPILVSGTDKRTQFGDVTVGPDGRTYVTWIEIRRRFGWTFVVKLRIAPAGSTSFGPPRHVRSERSTIPFGGRLQANRFQIATYPKHEVKMVAGHPRVYVVWEACSTRSRGILCQYPEILLTYSDDDGETWTEPIALSKPGVNYFPTIADDPTSDKLAVAWYTNRYDRFQNAQDVELVTIDADGSVLKRQRLTDPSNEPEADPLLGSVFIGDYIQTFAHAGIAYTHYNANYRFTRLLGEGGAVAQQDNYLTKAGM